MDKVEFEFENESQKAHFEFLDALRASGECNMFESPAWIMEVFPLVKRRESFTIFQKWADTFEDRGCPGSED